MTLHMNSFVNAVLTKRIFTAFEIIAACHSQNLPAKQTQCIVGILHKKRTFEDFWRLPSASLDVPEAFYRFIKIVVSSSDLLAIFFQ